MPILENGKRVDIIFNSLGVVNRLNSFQLIEQSVNFICNRAIERMQIVRSNKERENILFGIMKYFNEKTTEELRTYYNKLSESGKNAFFESIYEDGIYVHIPPLWEEVPMFDRLKMLYKEFPWIQPYKVYVQKFGRTIPMMKPLIVSEMYIMKLKQSSKKGFSSRSTSSISKKGVPEKSDSAKKNKELYSKTPVRIGIDENLNMLIGTSAEELAKLHMFYRSSVVGRKNLGKQLMTSVEQLEDFETTPDIKNRNVEVLQAYFKTMGLKLSFGEDKMYVDVKTDYISDKWYGDKYVIGDDVDHFNEKVLYEAEQKLIDEIFIGTKEQYQERLDEEIENIKAQYGSRFLKITLE